MNFSYDSDDPVVDELDEQTVACLHLWVAKFVIHIKDYKAGLSSHKLNHNLKYRSTPWGTAEHWLFLDQKTNVGSLMWICALFGLDPNRVRTNINPKWREIYVITRPVVLEAPRQAVIPDVPHAAPVAQDDIPTFIKRETRPERRSHRVG